MKGLWAVAVVGGALVLATAALPVRAADSGPALPLESTWTEEFCGLAARAANATDCNVVGRAARATGAVSAATRLVSPGGGTAAWSAEALSSGLVVANLRLTQPVRELDFVVEVRVNRASAALGAGAPGRAGSYLDSNLGRRAHVDVGAYALHSACSDCGGGTNIIVLSTFQPGTTVTTSGKDVVFHLKVTRQGGRDLPPGVVTVRAGVNAPVWQTNAWGDDSASVDAVVRKIALS